MVFVLVTGISGFVAAHVALSLLKKGHKVRGTVRSEAKADALKQVPELAHYVTNGTLTFVLVADITTSDFKQSLEGIEAVMHVASPFNTFFSKPEEFLKPAINGTLNLLQAADEAKIKNFVFTSSFAAVIDMSDTSAPLNGKVYTEKDWNPITFEDALQVDIPIVAYCASKKLAEKAVWDYLKASGSHMRIASLNPPLVLGPILNAPNKIADLNESNKQVFQLLNGPGIPDSPCPAWVDVRDLADAHVAALEKGVEGRFLVCAGAFENSQVVDFARNKFPELAHSLPESKGTTLVENPKLFKLDTSRARDELGITYRSFDETLRDLLKQLNQISVKVSA